MHFKKGALLLTKRIYNMFKKQTSIIKKYINEMLKKNSIKYIILRYSRSHYKEI